MDGADVLFVGGGLAIFAGLFFIVTGTWWGAAGILAGGVSIVLAFRKSRAKA